MIWQSTNSVKFLDPVKIESGAWWFRDIESFEDQQELEL
jgi:hypothetical protein